jgi:hypothetical protein
MAALLSSNDSNITHTTTGTSFCTMAGRLAAAVRHASLASYNNIYFSWFMVYYLDRRFF